MKSLPPEIEAKLRIAAHSYCQDWPYETYHPNDLTLFYEKGAHWAFAEAIEFVRAEVERRIGEMIKPRIQPQLPTTPIDELVKIKGWLSELQNKGGSETECVHESDGKIYTSLPPQYRCIKCRSYYR